jgi:thioredoxin 1
MRTYQAVGLLAVCSAVTFVVGLKVGEQRARRTVAPSESGSADCCGPLPQKAAQAKEAPRIPTASGLPCLLAFGSGECEQCKKADALLKELAPRLKGRVDVIHLDPDVYPAEAAKWRIRIIPTQIIVGADGKEIERIEKFVPEQELIGKLSAAGIKLAQAS